jgi:UPF0176 protein
MASIANISAYRFTRWPDVQALRDPIFEAAQLRGIKGTVLLAEEGINLFIAGDTDAVRGMLDWLAGEALFAGQLTPNTWSPKWSYSTAVPFKKLLVKVKREIIRMNEPAIQPNFDASAGHAQRAPNVDAKTLARWLAQGRDDAGREVVTLDTRNAFEVDYGKFDGALDWRIEKFSDFPEAVRTHAAALQGKTIVTYCTGGIRCEKAALYMSAQGIDHVLQLDGGILKYFEETGGVGYTGSCFVFDEREAVGQDLSALSVSRAADASARE